MSQPCVLVADNESIVAADLRDTVEEAGFVVEGPYGEISSALIAFQKHKPDVAILDVQFDDGVVDALAQKLADENVPIIFHSLRSSSENVASRFPGAKTLTKPCPPAEMIAAVNELLHVS